MALSNETNLGFHLAAGVDKYLTDTDYIHYKNYDSNNATLTDFLSTIGGTSGSVAYATKVGAPGTENTNYVTASSLINLYNWWTVAAADSKTDTAINKWKEVEAFLTGITDSLTLSGLLSGRVAKAGDTMSGALTINNNLTVTGASSLQGISGTTLNISGAATFSTPINGDLLGNATTADRLKQTEAVGSASLPVYFSGGLPVACTASSVFSSLTTNTTNAVSMTVVGLTRNITAADMKTSLGLGSNAYSSTAYIPLAGTSTTAPITGVLYIKDVDGLYINSNNLDKNIWHVVGNSGSWDSLYGFNLQYAGSGSGNSNDLILWAHNLTGTHVESYRIHQDGEFIFKAAPKIYKDSTSNYTILHSGNVSGGGSTWGSSLTVNGTTLTIPAQPTAVSGNAGTATTLLTSRNLWGNSFNGSADISGNITFPDSTFSSNPTDSNGLIWSGGTDGAKIFYRQTASNAGSLVLQVSDDGEEYIQFRHSKGGTVYLTPNTKEFYPDTTNTGSLGTSTYKWANVYATTFNGSLSGNASSATKVYINQHTGNNVNYPIVWTNTTGTTIGNTDLYKSGALLYFNSNSYKLTSIGGFIGNSLDINGTADIDSLTAGNLTVTGASTLTGDVSLGTVKSGTWNGARLTSSYIPTDVVYTTASLALTNKTYNGFTLAGACAKGIDTSIESTATDNNVPTSKAVYTLYSGVHSYGAFDIYDSDGTKKTSNDTVSATANNETLRLKEGANIAITASLGSNAGEDVIQIAVTGITSNVDRNGYGKLALWYNGATSASTTLQSATFNETLTVKAGSGIEFVGSNSGTAGSDVWTISAIPYNNASTLSTKIGKSLVKSSWTQDANSIFLTTDGTASGTALPVGTYAIYIEDRSYLKDQDKPDGSGKYTADGTPNYYSGMFVCAGSAAAGRLDELALHSSMATNADTDAPTRIFAATLISNTANKHCIRLSSQDESAKSHYLTIKVNRII